jgi:hypothetical protein
VGRWAPNFVPVATTKGSLPKPETLPSAGLIPPVEHTNLSKVSVSNKACARTARHLGAGRYLAPLRSGGEDSLTSPLLDAVGRQGCMSPSRGGSLAMIVALAALARVR